MYTEGIVLDYSICFPQNVCCKDSTEKMERHGGNFSITGCQNHDLWCHQWWRGCPHDNSIFSKPTLDWASNIMPQKPVGHWQRPLLIPGLDTKSSGIMVGLFPSFLPFGESIDVSSCWHQRKIGEILILHHATFCRWCHSIALILPVKNMKW